MRKIFNGYSLVVRPFIAIGHAVIEVVVSRGCCLEQAPRSGPRPVNRNIAEGSIGLAEGNEAKSSHVHFADGNAVDVEIALLLQRYGGTSDVAPAVGAGMGEGNGGVGMVIALHRRDGGGGDIVQGEIVDVQVDGIENGHSIHGGSRTIQSQVAESNSANRVEDLLDPRNIIDVIDVMHRRLDRRRVAVQGGNLKHLAAAAGTAAVGGAPGGAFNGVLDRKTMSP